MIAQPTHSLNILVVTRIKKQNKTEQKNGKNKEKIQDIKIPI
jgi:hypothetical protein